MCELDAIDVEYVRSVREMVQSIQWVLRNIGETNPYSEEMRQIVLYRIGKVEAVVGGPTEDITEVDVFISKGLAKRLNEAFEQFMEDAVRFQGYSVPE